LDKEKSKDMGLGQQNGFGPALLYNFGESGEWHSKD
jgi:hypothetical protein